MVRSKKIEMKIKIGFKIWLLIIAVLLSIISVFGIPPMFSQSGVLIQSADPSLVEQGISQGKIIVAVDKKPVDDLSDFLSSLEGRFESGENEKLIISLKDREDVILFTNSTPEITVSEIPDTNLKLGLDLAGGARALVQTKDNELTSEELDELISVVNNRLNVYGLSDIKVAPVSDLSGNKFMLIEIAGATPDDLDSLISEQGKFEAKIGDEIVFIGGNRDITSVCRSDATCAGIETCRESGEGYYCNFRFSIYLSEDAAKRHADITGEIPLNDSNPQYLEKSLELYLDDDLVDTLFISADLKGRETTQISISGSGSAQTQEDAYEAAEENMHKLQTILITGSLPYELEIVKLDTISPTLGYDFMKAIFLAAFAALIAVSLVVFVRYKKPKAAVALILTSLSEILIILGVASLIDWNLDLPSIAGILATMGTGIDQQIIVIDESKQEQSLSLKEKMKRAFTIILGAYFTTLVALLPLLWAGAGLLKGFAVTTIIGITVGVLITRPAFTEIVKRIEE